MVNRSNETRKVAAFVTGAGELREALDWERFVTRMYLLDERDVPLSHVRARWLASDGAIERFRAQGAALAPASGTRMRAALDEISADLEQIGAVRRRLLAGSITASFPQQHLYLKAEDGLDTITVLAVAATRERLTSIAADLKGSAQRSVLYDGLVVAIVLALAIGISVPRRRGSARCGRQPGAGRLARA